MTMNPRDPRQRRAGGPFGPSIDTAAAAIRLEVAAASMRADQLDRGPELVALPDDLQPAVAWAPNVAAAVQLGTHEPPLTAAAFAAALADVADRPEDVAGSPEPAAVAPLAPVDGAPSQAPVRVPEPVECRGCGTSDPAGERHIVGERKCCPDCDHRPVFSSERPRLTWRSRHDPRSLEFGVRAVLPGSAPLTDRLWPIGPVLDQGAEGECVGCAVVDAANVSLVAQLEPPLDLEDAAKLYHRAQQLDDVPGEDYSGTSVLAGMQAGVEAGLFGGYRWAFGTRDVAQAVLQLGPVVVGVPWLSGMYDTGPGGLVEVAGDDTGQGHCLAVVGIKLKGPQGQPGPYFVWQNSWGPSYGDGGLGYIHHRDLARLLHGVGEAAIPTAAAQVPGV